MYKTVPTHSISQKYSNLAMALSTHRCRMAMKVQSINSSQVPNTHHTNKFTSPAGTHMNNKIIQPYQKGILLERYAQRHRQVHTNLQHM